MIEQVRGRGWGCQCTVIRRRSRPVMSLGFAEGTLWCSQNHTASAGNQKEIKLHGDESFPRGMDNRKRNNAFQEVWKKPFRQGKMPQCQQVWYRISGTKFGRPKHSLCFALMEKMNPGCPRTRSNAYREIAIAEMWTGCAVVRLRGVRDVDQAGSSKINPSS